MIEWLKKLFGFDAPLHRIDYFTEENTPQFRGEHYEPKTWKEK